MSWMKVAILVLVSSISAAAAGAEAPESFTRYRCYSCHSDREAMTGPAFAQVAAAHSGRRDAVATIANDIRAGIRNGGPWHMPPHPEISVQDARRMARYIMSLTAKHVDAQRTKQSQ